MGAPSASLGGRLRAARHALGLRQADVAGRAGVDRGTIGKVERGRLRPGATTLRRIAGALGADLDELARLAASHAAATEAWRACAVCGREVWGTARRRYCGGRCRVAAFRDRAMAAAGRARLAACAECGAPLPSRYRNRMYCGTNCKVRAHRRRRAAEAAPDGMAGA